jgi:hypothetical protein
VLEAALAELAPFSHGAWHNLSVTLAETKNELGQYADAQRIVQTVLEGARGLGIELDTEPRARAALALARAGLGDPKGAALELQVQIDAVVALAPASVRGGMLRETACHIALLGRDYNAFSLQLDALGAVYAHHPSLRARHARWVRRGRERFRKLLAVLEKANAAKDWSARIAGQSSASTAEDRSEYLLSFVLEALQTEAGQLYRVTPERALELLASRPDADEPELAAAAERSLAAFWDSDEMQTADDEEEETAFVDSQGRTYVPLWLSKPNRADLVTGLVLVNCSTEHLSRLGQAFVAAVALQLDAIG